MAALQDDDCAEGMPFPEKVAWFTLISAAVVYSAFVGAVFAISAEELTVLRVVVLFTIALTVQGTVIGIARPLLALHHPEEARAPLDERDREVGHRAFKSAYLTLMGAIVILALAVPYAAATWQLTLGAYLAMVAADMVRMATTIINYRRRRD